MIPSEKKEKEKLPVHPNLSEIQARIDIALAKRAAIVDSWVSKYDTSRCAPDKTEAELKAWDEELYNPPPANLGLGAEIPKAYLDGEGNRMMNAGNGKLRTLMLGGQKIGKKRDEREKEESRKRAKAESSDEEEGRASLVKSKKAKHQKNGEDQKEKPAKVEKVNKALLAMQKQEEEEEKNRGQDNPWKNAPKPLSSLAKKKEKKSKHAELLTELASTSVVQKTTSTTAVTPAASSPKKESPLPIRTVNLPTSSSAPPSLGAPLNAAALALSISASDTASTSTPSIASSGSPSRSMGVELTEEERKRKERLKEKKRKQKEAKRKKKAEALVAAKAVGGDAEMKDA